MEFAARTQFILAQIELLGKRTCRWIRVDPLPASINQQAELLPYREAV
jgi:hypothetical protein